MLKNIRMSISCFLISLAVKTLPDDWRTEKAVKNLVSVKAIKV